MEGSEPSSEPWSARVQEAIGRDEVEQAAAALRAWAGSWGEAELEGEGTLLQSRVARLATELRTGVITRQEHDARRTELAQAGLQLAARIAAAGEPLRSTAPAPAPPAPGPPPSVGAVFVSHASADQATVVEPLVASLRTEGIEVWVDHDVLGSGDRLVRSIGEALGRARAVVAVISPGYLASTWTRTEIEAVLADEAATGRDRLVPLLHGLPADRAVEAFPLLADRLLLTIDDGIERLVARLAAMPVAAGPGAG